MNDQELYTKEELEMFGKIERGEFQRLPDDTLKSKKAQLKAAAAETIERKSRKKALNIRVIEEDILKIKAIALREGMPYQTYLASMIHKIANGEYQSTGQASTSV